MKNSRGFTLIELLVVIAIIGILSSVVLASLNSARSKGGDTAVKSNLTNMRSQAELVYDQANPNSYANVCSDPNIVAAISSAKNAAGISNATNNAIATAGSASTVTCHATSAGWAIEAPLKTAGYWCVDSTGAATSTAATTLAANDVACN